MQDELSKHDVFSLYANYVSSSKARFFKKFQMDLVMGRREGIYFYDKDGKRLINCHCNGGVFNLGHRHPEVLEALREALDCYDIGNHHLISEPRARLGEQLAKLAPPGLKKVTFGVSGGEAIDLALKMAMGHTGRKKIVSARGGYHGHTGLALATGDEKFRKPFRYELPGFVQVPFGDIDALQKEVDEHTAAVILEPIPATLGIVVPPDDYLPAVREICDRKGALFIADEVQTGLGRTGKFWAVEHYGAWPDILVTGKGLSGGIYPITATIYREELEALFHADPFVHISTFGGSELACMVALKVLDISSSPQFLTHVEQMAARFRVKMVEMGAAVGMQDVESAKHKKSRSPFALRQKGLMMGLQFPDVHRGMAACKLLYDHGIFAVFSGNDPSVVQFLPPLIVTEQQVDESVAILGKATGDLYGMKGRLLVSALKLFS